MKSINDSGRNLAGYLRSLPQDYLTKSPWITRTETRFTTQPQFTPSNVNFRGCGQENSLSHGTTSDSFTAHKVNNKLPRISALHSISNLLSSSNIEEKSEISSTGQISHVEESSSTNDKKNEQIILAVCFYHEKIGAAFYDVCTSQVYVVEDKAENNPEFWLLRTLFREITPKVVVLGGRQDNGLLNALRELSGVKNPLKTENAETSWPNDKRESTSNSSSNGSPLGSVDDISSNSEESLAQVSFVFRPASEFKYDTCYKRVLLYNWPELAKDSTDLQRESWLRGRLNMDAVAAVRALGGLLRFLELKSCTSINRSTFFKGSILGLHSYSMEDIVQVDDPTLVFLQVFSEDLHPASSKSGKPASSKEGLSLSALLGRTTSPLSPKVLKRVILRPIRNQEVLEARYDFLTWAMQPLNFDTIRQLQSCLKNICNVYVLFSKLQKSQMTVKDWKILYQSFFNMIVFVEICSTLDPRIKPFREIQTIDSENVSHATYLIQRILDFDEAEREGRFVVKPGLDRDLDEKKKKFSALGDAMQKVAELELRNLPEEIESCCIIYLPHLGYLLAISPSVILNTFLKKSDIDKGDNSTITVESYDIPGLQFKFETSDLVLFKSPLCIELDNELGDLQIEIANKETSIMMRLIELILCHSQTFIHLVSKALFVDVLLAFANVSRDFGWVRPTINNEGSLEGKEVRHPIYEMCNPTFVSNHIRCRTNDCPISLITGPNASGKTAYVKKVGLVAYLAHLGCFVPAETMTLQPLDNIIAVATTVPSATSGVSSFMLEMNRLILAVNRSTSKSLVLIDEFGSSTYAFDGASLLTSCLDFWTSQLMGTRDAPNSSRKTELRKGCPLVFVTTHFYKLYHFLSHPRFVKQLCMDIHEEGGKVIPLYQVVEGAAKKSFALEVARAAGVPVPITERAREVHSVISKTTSLPQAWSSQSSNEEKDTCATIVNDFIEYDLNCSLSNLFTKLDQYSNINHLESTESVGDASRGRSEEVVDPSAGGSHSIELGGKASKEIGSEGSREAVAAKNCMPPGLEAVRARVEGTQNFEIGLVSARNNGREVVSFERKQQTCQLSEISVLNLYADDDDDDDNQ